MISLILPYWDRQAAADIAISLLDRNYQNFDLEVIVVDDGNKVPFVTPKTDLNIRVVRLPEKDKPTPQSKAWNAGVKAARGDIVVLSCIEVLHNYPVLDELRNELEKVGEDGYVLAAAWCPDEGKWHCHTSEHIPTVPAGTGPAFCGVMRKSLFERAGGFDEAYHDGAGYEDKDFIWRLVSAGAKFVIRDDLVVTHPKAGALIRWPAEGFKRNAEIYFNKWGKDKPVTFVCLKAGSAYGPEYVNILRDMVARNLPEGYPGRFVCITDDPSGLDDGIDVIPLPEGLETWWGKLYMFKRGLFRDGTRCVFMDLDTLVIGSMVPLAKYSGQFATLRDFYYPNRLGPAIIAWEAGPFSASIWEEWVAQGKPRHPMGDLWWLNNLDQGRFPKEIDILQDVLPGTFASFKSDCKPYPPAGVSVVCFHGQPKPDNCQVEWVKDVWKIGGSGMAELDIIANTNRETVKANVLSACNRALPWLEIKPEHYRQTVIVAGGPSLKDTIPEIKWRKSLGQTVIACNGAAEFLNKHAICPDIQIIIDSRPDNVRFVKNALSKEYFLASQCDPALFEASGKNTTVFHMNTEGMGDILPSDKEAHLISSGSTVGLAAMAIAYTQGYRTLHLHGFDSSFSEDHHAYSQPENDADPIVEVSVMGERFKASPWMVAQVQQFQELATQLAQAGVTITVAGNGLLPFVAKCMGNPQQETTE